jgi:hypothetical protein
MIRAHHEEPMTVHAPAIEAFDAAPDPGDAIRCDVLVPVVQDRAFETFRHDIYHWWPRDVTWSGDTLQDLFLEGRRGGMFWERGPDGLRLDAARVMRWLPPEKFVLRWHIGPGRVPQPDPAKTSEVEFQFVAERTGHTRIRLEHRGFSRVGDGGPEFRAAMGSPTGWPHVLAAFARYCEIGVNLKKFRSEFD